MTLSARRLQSAADSPMGRETWALYLYIEFYAWRMQLPEGRTSMHGSHVCTSSTRHLCAGRSLAALHFWARLCVTQLFTLIWQEP